MATGAAFYMPSSDISARGKCAHFVSLEEEEAAKKDGATWMTSRLDFGWACGDMAVTSRWMHSGGKMVPGRGITEESGDEA